jgi:hypothetical protein
MKRLSVHTSWVHTSTKSVQSFEREVVINTNNLFFETLQSASIWMQVGLLLVGFLHKTKQLIAFESKKLAGA